MIAEGTLTNRRRAFVFGIVLLLAVLLLMNSAAIWIRNRAGRHRR